MKTIFFRFYLLSLTLIPLCAARAALDPAIVADDSHWVVYADFDALRGSVMGKELIAQIQKEQLEATHGKFAVNFQKVLETVRTATAYGTNISSNPKSIDGVLVVQGSPELRKIVEGFLVAQTMNGPGHVSELKDLPFPAYSISHGDKKTPFSEVIVGFPSEPIVLVSKSIPQLLKALEVFRGAKPSLAQATASPLHDLIGDAKDSYLFAAGIVPTDSRFARESAANRIVQLADSGSLAIGESGEQTFAHLRLHARSDDTADKMTKILQGMTAMASLAESSDKQLTEFLNSAAVTRNNDTVALNLSYSSARLAQMLQNLRQQHVAGRGREANFGKVVAEWKVDQKAEEAAAGAESLAWQTIRNVQLENGATLTLTGHRNGDRGVRFTRVEITPAEGSGRPLIFQAEYMRLMGFRADRKQPPAGGRFVEAMGPVSYAQLQFPAWDGAYTVRVAYAPQPGGKGSFTLSVKDPEAPANDDSSLQRGAH